MKAHPPTAVGYLDFHAIEGYGREGRVGKGSEGGRREKGLRVEWKNSFDIISNFFETRGRCAGLGPGLSRTCGVG